MSAPGSKAASTKQASRGVRPKWVMSMRMDEDTYQMVREVALSLDGVEDAPYFGVPAFKLNGHLLACPAGHPSADMNSLLVPVSFEQRDELLEADPGAYYLKPHYVNHPVVVVRVRRLHRDALKGLLEMVWQQVRKKKPRRGRSR
jgi:hypothetical protein